MKKQMAATLAAAFVLGVAGTSFAASNPFVDVPAKHWSYDAVTKLAKAGIVDGYGDGTFKGDKTITRYEMAQITAKAMAKSDKANAETKALVDKLAVEYAQELEGLNVRVTKLEKNASSVKVTGEARLRYENTNYNPDNSQANASTLKLRTRIHLNGNINDDWGYTGRFENTQNMRTSGSENTTDMNIANVHGHIGGIETTIGRQEYMPNYGLLLDTAMDGVKFSFGNVLKTNVYYGKNKNDEGFITPSQDYNVLGADFKYATSGVTNVTGGYYQLENKTLGTPDDKVKAWEIGFDTQISNDWSAQAGYAKVSWDATGKDEKNKAFFVGLNYKKADVKQVGSFGAFVNYRKIEENAVLVPTFDNAFVQDSKTSAIYGGKGYEVGFNYVPMQNAMFRAKYVDLKPTQENTGIDKKKLFQAQMEFFF